MKPTSGRHRGSNAGGARQGQAQDRGLGEPIAPGRQQAELVREAVARHPLVLVVEPADPADPQSGPGRSTRPGAEGVPVVLRQAGRWPASKTAASEPADRRPPKSRPARPRTRRRHARRRSSRQVAAVCASAKQLVASAIRNAKNAELDPKSGRIVVVNTIGDPFIPERESARSARRPQGRRDHDNRGGARSRTMSQAGEKLLTEQLAGQPQDRPGLRGRLAEFTGRPRGDQQRPQSIVPSSLAGYAAEEQLAERRPRMADFAAVAEFTPTRLVRKAISTAVALAQGRGRAALSSSFRSIVHDSPANSTAAQGADFSNAARQPRPRDRVEDAAQGWRPLHVRPLAGGEVGGRVMERSSIPIR